MINYIIIGIIGIAITLAVYRIVKNKNKCGCRTSCSCNDNDCTDCDECKSK